MHCVLRLRYKSLNVVVSKCTSRCPSFDLGLSIKFNKINNHCNKFSYLHGEGRPYYCNTISIHNWYCNINYISNTLIVLVGSEAVLQLQLILYSDSLLQLQFT